MIIIHTAMGIPICTLLMRNFFATVPNALREAAIVEGVNEWQVLTRIALPISLPALAVLATLQFTWIWNDFLWPLIFTQSDDKRTIMLGLVFLHGQYSVAWGVQGALSLIASLPTLIVFLFFQRYFIKGHDHGSGQGMSDVRAARASARPSAPSTSSRASTSTSPRASSSSSSAPRAAASRRCCA